MFKEKILSIDFGSQNIKMVIAKNNSKGIVVEKAFSVKTPQDSFEDGFITDINKIKEAIVSVIDLNGEKLKNAICTSQSTNIISREIIIPQTEEENIDSIVKFELEQYLPIDIENHIVQYIVLENIAEETLKKVRLNVVAYPKVMAETYLNLIKELNLKPIALDINSNAISKLFKNKCEVNGENYSLEETAAIIDIGHNNSNITIMSNGIDELNRMIPYAGKFIKINKSIQEGTEIFIREIDRVCQFYKNRKVENKIDKLYLYGGSSKIEGLENYISLQLNIPVYEINSINNISLTQNTNVELGFYLNSIGALIRLNGLEDFNFFAHYNLSVRRKIIKKDSNKIILGAISIAVALSLLGIINYVRVITLSREVNVVKNKYNSKEITEQIKKNDEINKKYEATRKYVQTVDELNKTIIAKYNIGTEIIKKVSDTLPKEVYFLNVSMDENGIQIQGKAQNRTSIAEIEHNLKNVKEFKSVHITAISSSKAEGTAANEYSFALKCSIKGDK